MGGALKIFENLGGWAKILAIFKNSIQPHFQPLSTLILYPKFTFFTEKSLLHYIAGKTVSAPPPIQITGASSHSLRYQRKSQKGHLAEFHFL